MASVDLLKNDQKLNELTDKLTAEFRRHAIKMGWEAQIANQIKVVWDENGIEFDVPPSIETQVDELEYGAVGSSPTRAFLTFKNMVAPQIVESFSAMFIDALLEADAF